MGRITEMKQAFIFLIIIFFVWSCSAPKRAIKVAKDDSVAEVDSVEYGVETFDAKFETWYALHDTPATYRTLEYYENWNKQYVNAWNTKSRQMGKSSFFSSIVGYNSNEKYGFEVNHKLFYYFQYVENVLKIEIMPGGPKVVPN